MPLNIFSSRFWDGYCPSCQLKNLQQPVLLNKDDFYECPACNTQLAVPYYGVQAVILKFKGNGKFRQAEEFAHTEVCGEILSPQVKDSFPFCDAIFENADAIENYIKTQIK